jgi:hypothetical protein
VRIFDEQTAQPHQSNYGLPAIVQADKGESVTEQDITEREKMAAKITLCMCITSIDQINDRVKKVAIKSGKKEGREKRDGKEIRVKEESGNRKYSETG